MTKYNPKTLNFFERVYEVVQLIPEGKVTSYGAIAKFLGASKSSRMVGWAMSASHGRYEVPAHRVVNSTGLLTGKDHFDTPTLMQELLENEGIEINNNKVIDFKEKFWDPNT